MTPFNLYLFGKVASVSSVMSTTTTAPLSKNEVLKQRIPTLAGNIAATLNDPALEKFSEDDEQFIKFHGIYQQDDRDLRKTGKKYIMMIRSRIPGGVMTSNRQSEPLTRSDRPADLRTKSRGPEKSKAL